jgi:NADPH:quinone reductase
MLQVRPGDGLSAQIEEVPIPTPQPGELLIRNAAIGANFPDFAQASGAYPPPEGASPVLGLEVAGIVEASSDPSIRLGTPVAALTNGGGYAQYTCVPVSQCLFLPPEAFPWSYGSLEALEPFREAAKAMLDQFGAPHGACDDPLSALAQWSMLACVPEALFTAFYNLFMVAKLGPGQVLLVHGGTGGVGSMAVQLGRRRGCVVVATAGGEDKCQLACEAGADLVIDYKAADFVSVLRERQARKALKELAVKRGGRVHELSMLGEAAGGGDGPVDVVLDVVGGEYVQKNIDVCGSFGRVVNIAFQSGSRVTVNLMRLMLKRQTLTGSTLRSQSRDEKASIAKQLHRVQWWHLFGPSDVPPTDFLELELASPGVHVSRHRTLAAHPRVTAAFRLEDAATVLERFASNSGVFKTVIFPNA